MQKIKSVKSMPEYRLEVFFEDGNHGIISLKDRLFGPMFEPLKDPEFFSQAAVDEFGAICWPNGADIAPDAVHEKIRSVPA